MKALYFKDWHHKKIVARLKNLVDHVKLKSLLFYDSEQIGNKFTDCPYERAHKKFPQYPVYRNNDHMCPFDLRNTTGLDGINPAGSSCFYSCSGFHPVKREKVLKGKEWKLWLLENCESILKEDKS